MSLEEEIVSDDEMNMIDEDDATDSEAESLSDSDTENEITEKLAEPTKTAVYNRAGLLDKLQDISWPEDVDWTHKLTIEIDQEQGIDVNDDLTREMAFYNQAHQGTIQGYEKFQERDEIFLRPANYYAEMVKSDTHMEKVKSKLLYEKKQMEESEERRKARDNKKMAKEVQSQKMKERAKEKKDNIESVKKWRKQRQQSGFSDKGDVPELDFESGKSFQRGGGKKRPGVSPGDRSGGKGKSASRMNNKKREFRDSKFGHGGRKGLSKQNTAETTNDFKGGFKGGKASGNKRQKR
ncbi:PREDICTED: probable rRNA-processing protein EBP2 homolog [Camelina sativa]|uniref:Probable rRNA-processing protein EBP2 homolog n=1 Tax=Camelina sativa TaxID=90675 RepID=A0ABM0W6X4_CAMSA|nr:PREDICTED: probable rRNA-processing protein EBP2 homolog [Camelina sativa]